MTICALCPKQALYNYAHLKPVYCGVHKMELMVDVHNKKCNHNIERSKCRICGGGHICVHNTRRSTCRICCGGSICEHNIERRKCRVCDPIGHLAKVVQSRVYKALKEHKEYKTMEYVDCSVEELKVHIENQFKEGMSWENYGEWHIDHIVPIKYQADGKAPTLEEVIQRLHYTNLQPLWASDNISKGNRYVG